ncbi:MAG: methyltransferase domain-containing protein [Prolixibacteraceae bacterium]|jgi:ubiquinone/menaquinone biosynthesis C-methylase UbiE|nr:methyltransferase domain-containing protein [Prolixibacteraceae bacterium]MBT6006201.1 methyltransferase domain-containing protein [Prolixibacteraceae bacterium]MBT6766760.1 methyltransferase domain-containing protein [Prolixibacteraceae bacterium]MBT6998856.1 methyltransferase domain-containing protein [Prolixibacteraceae bacterium]MBT7394199.1 methyltransferase domain-containing protein [Prolixibacteraceae bacterium]
MKQLIDFFKDKTVNNVLDVGTGTGNFLEILQETFQAAQITGVDPNPESLQEAEKLFPEISFQKMVAEKLEFTDNSFDAASISMALHHLPDVQKGLQEMRRVVKPGGWIIVNELFSNNLNPAQEVHKLYHHFGSNIDRILGVNHNSSFKKEVILQAVQESGFAIQFHFEHKKEVNLVADKTELESRIEKMKLNLEKIKGYPEYEQLKLQVEIFKEQALIHGFQPATKVVVIGKN